MSNIALFKSGAVAIPEYLQQADDLTKSLAGGSGGKQISIKGGVWRMIVGGEEIAKNEERALNLVILAANQYDNRTYYVGKYEEGKQIDPTCWSENGITPNEEVPVGQRQHVTCANCPQNIEGSGEGRSRACRYSKRLAVALENDLSGNVYRLQLPAKSIFGRQEGEKMPLKAYAKFLAGHGIPVTGVVTEARFDTSEAVPVLRFRAVRPLQREEWETAKTMAATEDAQRAVEFKMVFRPKAATPAAPAPAAAVFKDPDAVMPAASTYAEAPADDTPEPVKRASKKPVVQEPTQAKGSVADILNDWGTDDDE